MNKISFYILSICFSILSINGYSQEEIYDNIEFKMPKVVIPEFPDNNVLITDFGAVGDGFTLNTSAISKAIGDIANRGGGTVTIPRGIWLTGPIVLKSNINLHVEKGALVVFSKNKDLYPLIESYYEGVEDLRCQSPISGKNLENIAITGEGIFDGSGDVWRMIKRFKLTEKQWKTVVKSGGVTNDDETIWYTSEAHKKGSERNKKDDDKNFKSIEDYYEIRDYFRPVMLSLISCKNVLIDGPVFQNSPNWTLHPLMCESVTVRNVDVKNPWYSQNGDGIDVESCKNVLVYNNTFDTGDDAICIKSGKDKSGRDRAIPSENIIVKNNVVYHGHGGVVVGSEMSGGVKNLHVSNCTFIGTDVGLRFKSRRGRGGVVENIYISNIDMINIPTNAISFNMYYQNKSVSEMLASKDNESTVEEIIPVNEETPQFRNIYIKDVKCNGAYQAIYLQGLPEMKLENVHLENLNMSAKNGLTCIDADGVEVKNLRLDIENVPAVSFHNSSNVRVSDLELVKTAKENVSISGNETKNINIKLTNDGGENITEVQFGENVKKREVSLK